MKEFSDDDRLYLDDFHIGKRFTSGTHVVDEEQIKAFARQFDPQPFHLDNEAAKETLFSGLTASGWHTAAITARLLVEGGLPLADGIVGAGVELDWPNPTRPGDKSEGKNPRVQTGSRRSVRTNRRPERRARILFDQRRQRESVPLPRAAAEFH